VLLALLLPGCGEDEPAPTAAAATPAPRTELRVVVDPDGKGPQRPRERRVRCPGPSARACAAVERVPLSAYERPPADQACTGQFGGSETGRITGRVNGTRVDASYSRRTGCETARWDEAAPLLALAEG
jgi:hypothetical protein